MLPPGAGTRRPGRADAAPARRPATPPRSPAPSSSPRRRWPSGSCGPSARSRDNHIAYRIPSAGRAPRPAPRGARRHLPDLQRGPHRHLRRRRSCAPTCRPRRSASAGVLVELMPDEPEARRAAGAACCSPTPAGRPAPRPTASLVRLADQDRTLWDRALIAEGHDLVRACLRRNQPGPVPDPGRDRRRARRRGDRRRDTDWAQIVALYDQLDALRADRGGRAQPGRSRSRERDGADRRPRGARRGRPRPLAAYHLFHAARADLLARRGRHDEATDAYDRAIELAANQTERQFLLARRAEVADGGPDPARARRRARASRREPGPLEAGWSGRSGGRRPVGGGDRGYCRHHRALRVRRYFWIERTTGCGQFRSAIGRNLCQDRGRGHAQPAAPPPQPPVRPARGGARPIWPPRPR